MMIAMMIKAAVLILLVNFSMAFSQDCDEEHEYLDEENNCQICKICLPGYEPTLYHCGFGSKSPLYNCQKCKAGTFSSAKDYNFCVTCQPCTRWNAITTAQCSSTTNSVCGECHFGYYRPQRSDGQVDKECLKCTPNSDLAACKIEGTIVDMKWTNIILTVAVTVLVVIVVFCCVCWVCYRRRRNDSLIKGSLSKSESMTSKRSSLQPIISCSSNSSLVPLTPKPPLKHRSQDEARRPCNHDTSLTYSNLPTVEFQQSDDLYPHLPTNQFHTSQFQNQRFNVERNFPGFNNAIDLHAGTSPMTNRSDRDFSQILPDAFDTSSISKQSTTHSQFGSFQRADIVQLI